MAALVLLLTSCHEPPAVEILGNQAPDFDLIAQFTGHVRSWGVVENRSGEPSGWVETDCTGTVDGAGALHMSQHLLQEDGTAQDRAWIVRRTGPHSWDATANDMAGTAHGTAAGRTFHWHWTLAHGPGKPPVDVEMDQWMYLLDDGSMLNRTTVRKYGIILAEVTERFARAP
ncbi:MAG: DUF3833 family protein [Acetobacteraceae bacterium]|nr:DUF3833 family protein [Acetobacteraceae bacterium]